MKYERHYSSADKATNDKVAIKDIKKYLNAEAWDTLMQMVGDPQTTIQHINIALAIAGISGYPFHAFCRKYMLEKYREWLGDEYPTDEQGYPLEERELSKHG